MCGIAGYNCSRHLLDGKSDTWIEDVTTKGLLLNEMRGKDASGWMATYRYDDRPSSEHKTTLWYHKYHDTASVFVKKNPLPVGLPIALGLHTRDFTKGTPLNNNNNHPVKFNGILVTHNGSIDNYEAIIRNANLSVGEKGALGDVDSAAIPVFLSSVEKPTENIDKLDSVIESLHTLRGKYTFHAMWYNDPGVSLIVAGPDRPMWYMHNEVQSLHVYASEKEAARAMYKQFGIANRQTLREGELQPGTAMLIREGEILRKWNFELPTSITTTYSSIATMKRVSTFPIVLQNATSNHWTKENAPLTLEEAQGLVGTSTICVQHMDDAVVSKDSLTQQIIESLKARPLASSWIGWEADEVWVAIPGVLSAEPSWLNYKIRFFTIYGETLEMIWDNSFKMLDIYNWSKTANVKDYPWKELPFAEQAKKDTTAVVDCTDKAWFNKRLNKRAPIATKQVEARIDRNSGWDWSQPFRQQPIAKASADVVDSLEEWFVPSVINPKIVFWQNSYCIQHSSTFEMHSKPLECSKAVESAWDMLFSIKDLNDAKDVYSFAVIATRGKSMCHELNEDHIWEATQNMKHTLAVEQPNGDYLEWSGQYVVAEKCVRPNCSLFRQWKNPPHFGHEKKVG